MTTAPRVQSEAISPEPREPSSPRSQLEQGWLDSPLAKVLAERELRLLESVMPRVYRPVCVHISLLETCDPLGLSTGGLNFRIQDSPGALIDAQSIRARPDALPFAARSVDLIILSHVLEFSDNPHEVLRQVDQTLAPGGHFVLIGFNPISLWGLRRFFHRVTRRNKSHLWQGNWLRLARIRDWIRLLGLESTGGRIGVYNLPIQSERLQKRFKLLEKAGARWWPGLGAVYAIVVTKREMGATPIRHDLRRKTRLRPGLVTPMSRGRSSKNASTS